MASPRICLVAPEFLGPFQNGGVGTSCYWEATALAAAGFDVTVLYTGPTERQTPDYWEFHYEARSRFRFVDLYHWAKAMDRERAVATYDLQSPQDRVSHLVLDYLRAHRFDLILFQEFLGHGARALQAREAGVALQDARTAVTMHSCRQWIYEGMCRLPTNREDTVVDFLERESSRLADRLIAPSAYMAQWARTQWRLDRDIDAIFNCYDESVGGPRRVVAHEGPFDHLIFFGRLETRKGLHLFVSALAESDTLRNQVRKVTFLGRHSRVNDRPSEEFLAEALAAMPWLETEVKSDLGSLEALAWIQSQQHALVVTPSLGDNLPYGAVELHSRRIPFVSTQIGGIPEIVGERNRHQLAPATVDGIREVLERTCDDGRLVIDYSCGYDARKANAAHVALVKKLLATPRPAAAASAAGVNIVVADAVSSEEVDSVRRSLHTADTDALGDVHWSTVPEWRASRRPVPSIFIDQTVTPDAALFATLLNTLRQPGVGAATTAYRVKERERPVVIPLGHSLENGWRWNCFGGPCVAVTPDAGQLLDAALASEPFGFWRAYADLACRGVRLALVPDALYEADEPAPPVLRDLEAVVAAYQQYRPESLDLGWVLKTALPAFAQMTPAHPAPGKPMSALSKPAQPAATTGSGTTRPVSTPPVLIGDPVLTAHTGRSLYDRFIALPDNELRAYAALDAGSPSDPVLRQFETVRRRLDEASAEWNVSTRVLVYGAGQHTRMLLAAYPAIGPFIRGFIDSAPLESYLGKPCIRPDVVHKDMAEAIVYSSREFETEMHRRLAHVPVEHILLYSSER